MAAEGGSARNIKLYLGNLSFNTNEEDIREIASQCGHLRFCAVRRYPYTNKSRGFGHIEFRHEDEALRAFELLHNRLIRGRSVRVDWCDDYYRKKYPELGLESVKHRGAREDEKWTSELKRKRVYEEEQLQIVDAEGHINPLFHQISGILSMADLLRILALIQKLTKQCPEAAKSILNHNPHLCYPILHAQSILGLLQVDFEAVSANKLKEVLDYQEKYDLIHANENAVIRSEDYAASNSLQVDSIEQVPATMRLNFNTAHEPLVRNVSNNGAPQLPVTSFPESSGNIVKAPRLNNPTQPSSLQSSRPYLSKEGTSLLRNSSNKEDWDTMVWQDHQDYPPISGDRIEEFHNLEPPLGSRHPYTHLHTAKSNVEVPPALPIQLQDTSLVTNPAAQPQFEALDPHDDGDIPLATTAIVNEVIRDRRMLEK